MFGVFWCRVCASLVLGFMSLGHHSVVQGETRVSMTRTSETVRLKKCCEYQAQFSEQTSLCTSTADPNKLLKFDDTLRIPQHAFTYVYATTSPNQILGNVTLGLKEGSLECFQGGSFSATLQLDKKNANDSSNLATFTPNGYLQVGSDYYATGEYCVDASSEEKVTLAVCKPTCESKKHPCIPKFCDYGQAWDFGGTSRIPQCRNQEGADSPWGTNALRRSLHPDAT